jgi:bifunctional UDP-N-acetylglucosamine pyrophosphorylase/glucosamine-1-phosphate N-acetyltransferase
MDISIAIMAAGLGTRMKSKIPKVLHKLSGFEMLYHIIKEAKKISDDIYVILYHQSDLVQKEMNKYFENINYIIQDHENFPGTGGAIMSVNPKYDKLLVLNGDMPLLEDKDMVMFTKEKSSVVMSSFTLQDSNGYGRVLLDANQNVEKIVEEKDASEKEKDINLVNAGVYLFSTKFLKENLSKLTNDNQQKEFYITDLIKIANQNSINVKTIMVDKDTFMGVNSKYHLSLAEELMQKRIKKRFM